MATKAWEFHLPATGQVHQVFAEELGKPEQRVCIDGVVQAGTTGIYTGPGDSLIELRLSSASHKWQLTVNGLIVEDYSAGRRDSGDDSLRQLRSLPDGQYMIAPQLEATGLACPIVKEFVFIAFGQKHAVQVSHEAENHLLQMAAPQAVWEIIFDGHVISRVSGDERGFNAEVPFVASLAGSHSMDAVLRITWVKWPVPAHYRYRLTVGGVNVPAYEGKASPAGRMPTGIEGIPVVMASESSPEPAVFLSGIECEYLVDNRRLRAHTRGLGYRFSKDFADKNPDHTEHWGSTIVGVAEDDGWVKVGEEYLPTILEGVPVLMLMQAAEELPEQPPAEAEEPASAEQVDVASLPQGVSLNRETGRFQATIKSKTGRWIDLGDYATPEEAHQRYVEAMPIHNPDKVLAPSLPGA